MPNNVENYKQRGHILSIMHAEVVCKAEMYIGPYHYFARENCMGNILGEGCTSLKLQLLSLGLTQVLK